MPALKIPNNWEPRAYQLPLWRYLEDGGKRGVAVWHRRSGKDSTALNWTCHAAMRRIGTFYHMLPELKHGRKVVWDAIDGKGRRVIDQVFPKEIRESTNEQEMRIRLINGSVWQLVGSDNYDALVGTNPVGVVFSEWALSDPRAWEFMRPILAENGGWALFIYTPRGQNHGADLYNMGVGAPDWHAELLTVEDTHAISDQSIEDERAAGMPDDLIRQEFFCSFSAGVPGAFFAAALEAAEDDGRLCRVPLVPELPVHTAWDLGFADATAIWLAQAVGPEVRLVGYIENSGVGLEWFAKELDKLPCKFGEHFLPPDVAVRELGTGLSRKAMLGKLGIKATVVPAASIEDGIGAARNLIARCWFDTVRCERGLKALKNYRCEYDAKAATYRTAPVHDWSSHASDAFRYLAIGLGRHEAKDRRQRYGLRSTWAHSPAARGLAFGPGRDRGLR